MAEPVSDLYRQLWFLGWQWRSEGYQAWGGRSPRALTEGHRLRIFKAQAVKKRERSGLCSQLELGPELAKEGPPVKPGGSFISRLREDDHG